MENEKLITARDALADLHRVDDALARTRKALAEAETLAREQADKQAATDVARALAGEKPEPVSRAHVAALAEADRNKRLAEALQERRAAALGVLARERQAVAAGIDAAGTEVLKALSAEYRKALAPALAVMARAASYGAAYPHIVGRVHGHELADPFEAGGVAVLFRGRVYKADGSNAPLDAGGLPLPEGAEGLRAARQLMRDMDAALRTTPKEA